MTTRLGGVAAMPTRSPLLECHGGPTVTDRQHLVYPDVIDTGGGTRKAGPMPARPTFQAALGQAVRARREELGLTQEAIALKGDLHMRWVSNVENGWRNPSYLSLRRLAASLDLSTSELIAHAEQIERKMPPTRKRTTAKR